MNCKMKPPTCTSCNMTFKESRCSKVNQQIKALGGKKKKKQHELMSHRQNAICENRPTRMYGLQLGQEQLAVRLLIQREERMVERY